MWDESKHPRDKDGKFIKKFSSFARQQKDGAEESVEETHGKGKKKQFFNRQKPLETYDPAYIHKPNHIAGAPKGEPMTHEEADSGRVNPKYGTNDAYGDNCVMCVAAYIARRQGYDVQALPFLDTNSTMNNVAANPLEIFKQKDLYFVKQKKGQTPLDLFEQECYNDDRYVLDYALLNNQYRHIIVAEKTGKGMRLYDPQKDQTISGESAIKKYLKRVRNLKVANVSGAFIDEKKADKIMRRR